MFGPLRSGPGKKMTANSNTNTSAVICPVESDGTWHVAVYHNRFARHPLGPSAIFGASVTHWEISSDEREWVPPAVLSNER